MPPDACFYRGQEAGKGGRGLVEVKLQDRQPRVRMVSTGHRKVIGAQPGATASRRRSLYQLSDIR